MFKVRPEGQLQPVFWFNMAPHVIWQNLSVMASSESPSAAQDLAISRTLQDLVRSFSLSCVFTTHSHKSRQFIFAATEENLHLPSLFRTGDNRQ